MTIRVALASPSDVQEERDKVQEVINEINPLLDRELDLTLVLYRWETLPPESNNRGPQAIIDRALAPEHADLFIAIFATRFGTPLPDGLTGTEHEFLSAYRAWLARGKPEIMLYFRRGPTIASSPAIGPQFGSVQGFKDDVASRNMALWREYNAVSEFERMLRMALIEYALKNSCRSKTSAPRPPKIEWSVKFVPREHGLAELRVRDEVMKDLQNASGDSFLRLRKVALDSDSVTVEGTPEGYSTFKQLIRAGGLHSVGPLEVLDVWRLNLSAPDLVQPLYRADSHLLQVLVRKFNLSRRGSGVHATVEFDRDSPAIWRREARVRVRQHLSEEQKRECQEEIDAVIDGKKNAFAFTDYDFPFRHANGGVLPIIQAGDKRYYSLFYRETDPIGWNIANGGSDDSDELIDPQQTILRELREELIVVGPPSTNRRYTLFQGDKGAHNRPEYLKALDLWKGIVGNWPSLDRRRRHDVEADIEWEIGPDSVTVLASDYGINEFSNIYVNITTPDCAIEVDRVAILRAPPDFRLLDGEVYGGTLVNRPIGLFETSKFNAVGDLRS